MKKNFMNLLLAGTLYNIILANNSTQSLASGYVECGGVAFPEGVVTVVHSLILLLQLVVPIIIIIYGSLDFVKATAAKNQEEISKKQKVFIKRLLAGGAVFLIASMVQLVVTMVASDTNYKACIKCLVKGENSCGSAVSPNNPDFPNANSLLYNPDDGFVTPQLKPGAYQLDNSNIASDSSNQSSGNSQNMGNADLSTIGIGNDPNKTAAPLGTTSAEPSGKQVKAIFTAYYPANNSMEGGFHDCKGHKLQTSKQTCAAPKSVPYGSIVWIKSIDGSSFQEYVGRPYVVTDRGGAIVISNGVYHIDLLFKDKKSANAWGKRTGTAVIVER